MPLLARFDKV